METDYQNSTPVADPLVLSILSILGGSDWVDVETCETTTKFRLQVSANRKEIRIRSSNDVIWHGVVATTAVKIWRTLTA